MTWFDLTLKSLAAALACACVAVSLPVSAQQSARWDALKPKLFEDRVIGTADGVISLEVPKRAHDAALVPVKISAAFAQSAERHITNITLIVDENPSPIAGVFELTPDSGIATIGTRVRINAYSTVRAIAETDDGSLHMATRYVKASGGCSAPAMKDAAQANKGVGKMKLRHTQGIKLNQPTLAQLLIKHPNHTGMQMNQITQHYIPAFFLKRIEVRYGGRTILKVTGDISMSENPSIHFYYVPDGKGEMTVEAVDTKDLTYASSWTVDPQSEPVAGIPADEPRSN